MHARRLITAAAAGLKLPSVITLTAAGLALLSVVSAGCRSTKPRQIEILHAFPLDSLDGVLTRDGVAIDHNVSSDGHGSLRIQADGTRTVRLFELGDIDVEDGILSYRARLRTKDLDGKAYLEMWCSFPGTGEYFSRALNSPVSGTTDWVTQQTPFRLDKGQNPDNVKLNLVVEGTGTVWIDDAVVTMATR